VRNGRWDRHITLPRGTLQNATLGLIGFGHVARQVARKLSGFNMRVLACDPYVGRDVMEGYGAEKCSLNEALSEGDFISIHCALTAETKDLIDADALKLMKPSAILVNTSRGPVVNEAALIQALTEGWIAGAGLDVVHDEPPDPNNPLLKLDNVVVTPHIAAYSDRFVESFWRYSLETALDLARGRWPRSYVNPEVKPRWQLT
jgi:D-3-phosphoglycerate dehydrogenase